MNPVRINRRELVRMATGLVCGEASAAEPLSLPPIDQASRDPQLTELLRKIRRLVVRHDFRGLEALMLPTFRVEFDAGKGPAAFHREWHADRPSSPLWGVMKRLFSLGGTFYSDTLFALPYVYTQFPVHLDPLAYVVAVKPGTRLLDRPAQDGTVVGRSDYTILPLAQQLRPPVLITEGRYLEVKAPGGERCFVPESEIYSPAAHRAFFEKRAGHWHWISLVCATLAEPPDLKKTKLPK